MALKAVVIARPPASFLQLANRPLVGHALDWLAAGGVCETAVVGPAALTAPFRESVSHGLERPPAWFDELPGGGLSKALPAIEEFLDGAPFVLHLADSMARCDLGGLLPVSGPDSRDTLLLVQEGAPDHRERIVDLQARRSGAPSISCATETLAGVAVMGAAALEAAATLEASAYFDLATLADRARELGGRVSTCPVTDWWRYRGGSDAHLAGNRFALEGLRADHSHAHIVDSDLQGVVIAHPDAQIRSSVIRGPAIIGARSSVCEAYVGPYTSIGDDVIIEGAEIEHSVIHSGAEIAHLGGRLEASVIGRGARIFRDFRLPRALRVQVGEGAEVSLA